MSTRLRVNGAVHDVDAPPRASLLQVLHHDLQLNGPKYGCGLGQCGACTVLIDGVAARSCCTPLAGVGGREVTTLEGLTRPDGTLHPVQQAFVDAQAAQCGFCLNGMVMTVAALLRRVPSPTDARLRAELSHNLCRCGTHVEILQAARLAAERMAAEGAITADRMQAASSPSP